MPVDTFDMESDTPAMQQAGLARQRPSQVAQFAAVLKKNFIIQTRSRKAFFGIGGWSALLIEMLVPGLFFLLMCIPKYYVPSSPSPRQLPTAYSLDSSSWAQGYRGEASRLQLCETQPAPMLQPKALSTLPQQATPLLCPEVALFAPSPK